MMPQIITASKNIIKAVPLFAKTRKAISNDVG
jgi:hypothetical protein